MISDQMSGSHDLSQGDVANLSADSQGPPDAPAPGDPAAATGASFGTGPQEGGTTANPQPHSLLPPINLGKDQEQPLISGDVIDSSDVKSVRPEDQNMTNASFNADTSANALRNK